MLQDEILHLSFSVLQTAAAVCSAAADACNIAFLEVAHGTAYDDDDIDRGIPDESSTVDTFMVKVRC